MLPLLQSCDLQNGDRLTRDEFLRRWEQLPELKHAELIEGVVYLASPVSYAHGSYDSLFQQWLGYYAYVSGQELAITGNGTLLIGESALQPDAALLREPVIGKSGRPYLEQIPDLVVEVAYSSGSYDLGPKLAAYRVGGVREHIAVLLEEQRVEWRVLERGHYAVLPPGKDRILRSPCFPGLSLDTQALFPPDRRRLFAAIRTPD
jgi:Uma2 family endonuclease